MNFIEFIGFVVALIALTYLNIRKKREEYRRKGASEAEEDEYDDDEELGERSRELMRQLDLTRQEVHQYRKSVEKRGGVKSKRPPPPPQPPQHLEQRQSPSKSLLSPDYQFKSKLDAYQHKTAIEQRKFETQIEKTVDHEYAWSDEHTEAKASDHAYAIQKPQRKLEALRLLQGTRAKRNAILLHVIMGEPRAMQDYDPSRR